MKIYILLVIKGYKALLLGAPSSKEIGLLLLKRV